MIATILHDALQAGSTMTPLLGEALVKTLALLLIGFTGIGLGRRASAAMRHLAWSLLLGGTLVLPVLSLALPQWHVLPRFFATMSQEKMHATVIGPNITPAAIDLPADKARRPLDVVLKPDVARHGVAPLLESSWTVSWQAVAMAIWFAGMIACVMPSILGQVVVRRLNKRSRRIVEGPWANLLHRLSAEMCVRGKVHLILSESNQMPMTWGILRRCVLIPCDAEQWPESRRRAVLLHELAHIRRRDCVTLLIGRLACAVHWFNPLIWIANRRMLAEQERACDDLVLLRGDSPAQYAEHLLHVAANAVSGFRLAAVAIAMGRPAQFESRVAAILDSERNHQIVSTRRKAAITLVTTILALPLAMLHGADTRPAAVLPETRPGLTTSFALASSGVYRVKARIHYLDLFDNKKPKLAAPQLVVRDGEQAQLLMGGEVPFRQKAGRAEYMSFGTKLEVRVVGRPDGQLEEELWFSESNLEVDNKDPLIRESGIRTFRVVSLGEKITLKINDTTTIELQTDPASAEEIAKLPARVAKSAPAVNVGGLTGTGMVRLPNFVRHFVRLVIGPDHATFQGEDTNWDQLPTQLNDVPDRPHTVLELAVSGPDVTVGQLNDARSRGVALAKEFNFEYLSEIGEQKLGSSGSADQTTVPAASLAALNGAATDWAPMPANPDLSHVVHFELGDKNVLDGDEITITEVVGTADTIAPGNMYRVSGRYTLASYDRASLSAYVTAKDLAHATGGPHDPRQSIDVKKGSGTFTVMLLMTCEGSPHVSLYRRDAAGNGYGIASVYFGTGESVQKKQSR